MRKATKKNNRILIIGIDGGTFEIIRPMVERGELPNIEGLMKSGVSADLQSTIPPITAPAWLSFMTGKNPGKHGIFHFIGDTHKTYRGKVKSATDLKAKTIWTILSEHNKYMTLVNVPLTYPPTPINGIMISGIGTPLGSQNFTYPKDIYKELLREVGDYKVDYTDDRILLSGDNISAHLQDLIQNLNYMSAKRTGSVLYLLKRYDWDLFMVVYVIADRLQHIYWKFMDTSHPDHDPELAKLFGKAIFEGYRTVDEAIGRILSEAGNDVTVIIMSDHGFGPLYKCFFVNNWLMKIGLLTLKRTLPIHFSMTHTPVKRILTKLGMGITGKFLPQEILRLRIPRLSMTPKKWDELVDWSRTKAYAADDLGISINLKNREPKGIVNPGEDFEKLLKFVEDELYKLKDSEKGEQVVDRVVRREKLYTGPYVDEAPDLLFAMKGLSYLPDPYRIHSQDIFGPHPNRWSGTHRFNGILMMKGPEIKPSVSLSNPKIIDIAPTILYILDQKVPRGMDGRVLEEAFHPNVLNTYPIIYDESEGQEGQKPLDLLSKGDEEEICRHLKGLGYLS